MADLDRRIAAVAADHESGATEILEQVLDILRTALPDAALVRKATRALCEAQPTMASVWNASLAAQAALEDPSQFEEFVDRVSRGPEGVTRAALERLGPSRDSAQATLRVVTLSYSHTVAMVLERLHQVRPLRVSCGEGRPALEGRRLATRLAAAGIPVLYFGDAAIGQALGAADVVLVGADAVSPEWFLNKTGTRMLAAMAGTLGIPVYVAATSDKFVGHSLASQLSALEGSPDEIWDAAPAGVAVRNPYFDSTSLDLVTEVIADLGALTPVMVAEVCAAITGDRSDVPIIDPTI